MEMRKYKATFTDSFGEETIEISSDGSIMYLPLRGVIFDGVDFELLTGDKVDLAKFHYEIANVNDHFLTNFGITVTFPINIEHQQKITTEQITFTYTTGDQTGIKGRALNTDTVILDTYFGQFTLTKKVQHFEESLLDIQVKLPKGTDIKACLSCKYSTYHPLGGVDFGDMTCLKNVKELLPKIHDKSSLMDVYDEAFAGDKAFKVQEIFLCPEHESETLDDWRYKGWSHTVK